MSYELLFSYHVIRIFLCLVKKLHVLDKNKDSERGTDVVT